MLWGGYYAVLLIAEKLFLLRKLEKAPGFLRHLYTMTAVTLGWSLFYFEDLGALVSFLGQLLTPAGSGGSYTVMAAYLPLFLAAALGATPLPAGWFRRLPEGLGSLLKIILLFLGLLLCVAALASQSYNPFIYFRF